MAFGLSHIVPHRLRALTLDLPEAIAFVAETGGDKPPVYLLGPLPASGEATPETPRIVPQSRSWTGRLVTFTFDGGVGRGSYLVVVHASRFRTESGAPLLLEEDGRPWRGETITVTSDDDPAGYAPERAADQERYDAETSGRLSPPLHTIGTFRVFVDGREVPPGASELSGEVVTVEAPPGARVELRLEPLDGAGPFSRYSDYVVLRRRPAGGAAPGTLYWHDFAAAGPIGGERWVSYYGHATEGRLPRSADGRLAFTNAVVRPPLPAGHDPRITALEPARSVEEALAALGVRRVQYRVRTHASAVPGAPPALPETYTSRIFYYAEGVTAPVHLYARARYSADYGALAEAILAADPAPGTAPGEDPVLLPAPSAPAEITFEDVGGAAPPPATEPPAAPPVYAPATALAAFDLPARCRLSVYVDELRVWWGQTRLVPLLIPAERFLLQTTGRLISGVSPAEVADVRLALLRASEEALRLWRGPCATRATPTMEAFVETRLAYGYGHEDGHQGEVYIRQGDTSFSGKSDERLLRRLRALIALLEAGEADLPVLPEDGLPTGVARLGARSPWRFHPDVREHVPIVAPYTGEHAPLDPDLFARRGRHGETLF